MRPEQLPTPLQIKIQECVSLFKEFGFGPDGPPLETSFAQIEDFGHGAGRLVACLIQEALAKDHAQHFQSAATTCPQCKTVSPTKPTTSQRTFKTCDGEVALHEPTFHCPECHRDFFPSTHLAQD